MITKRIGIALLTVGFLIGCSRAPSGPPEQEQDGEAAPEEQSQELIVARVNGQPIYRGTYQHSLTVLRDRLANTKNSVDEYLNAKFDALEGIIANELLYQEAERTGVSVSESALYAELDRIGQDKGGVDGFVGWMQGFGMTRDQVIDNVRKRLTVDRYIEQTITSTIEVDEQEVRDYYDENLERFREPLAVRVSQILIRCERGWPQDRIEERRQRAEDLLDKIRGGGAFGAIAREYSEDRSSVIDGDIGFLRKGMTYPEFEAAAFELETGEMSDIVRTDAGFHIILVTDRRGGELEDFETVKDTCRQAVINGKRNARVRETIDSLRRAADVESYLN